MNKSEEQIKESGTVLKEFVEKATNIIDHIERQRSRLDTICNRINYSEYYKNQPIPSCDTTCKSHPDADDAKFYLEKLIERLQNEHDQINMSVTFISNFV